VCVSERERKRVSVKEREGECVTYEGFFIHFLLFFSIMIKVLECQEFFLLPVQHSRDNVVDVVTMA